MITTNEYQKRRQILASHLAPNSLAIIPAALEVTRSNDTNYRFRQDSNFFYLTGFNEPCAILVITSSQGKSYLFTRPNNSFEEQWTGRRLGINQAIHTLKVDDAFSIDDFAHKLAELMQDMQSIYYPFGSKIEKLLFDTRHGLATKSRRGIKAPDNFCDIGAILCEMRVIKTKTEVLALQKAMDISIDAHIRAMTLAKKLNFEYELEAELMYAMNLQGVKSCAYDSIVASGSNACVLHYTDNNNKLSKNELILIDAGAEFNNYAADITRTFPKNGKFSTPQKQLYQLVLDAQRAGIAKIAPNVRWNKIQEAIVLVLTRGLVELKILTGKIDDLIAKEAYKRFYMHGSGHWLGLDVHDVGAYKHENNWRLLEENMVLTVEPGLYIDKNDKTVPCEFRGIGIRIEDDILVTKTGSHNMTEKLVVEIDDVEALIQNA